MKSVIHELQKGNFKIVSKKLIVTAILALMPAMFFGQASAFDKFDGPDDIVTVVVTKKMFQMMGNVKHKESQEYLNLVKKLDNLRVFTTSNPKHAADMKATAEKYIKSARLEELMRISEGGQNIKIMVKTGGSETRVRELLMFIDGKGKGQETVLMSLTGDFDLNDISALTEKMDLPGGNVLMKAGKGPKGKK
jgi:hypothetical protein